MPLLQPFQATTVTFKNTIEERGSVTAEHAVSNKVAQLHPTPSSSRGALPDVAI
jgi:hypothetical protein